ncbi:hypothetical protein ACVWXB_000360 [Streptomyces sp. TE12347]
MSKPMAVGTMGSRMWLQRMRASAMTGRVAKNLPAKHRTATAILVGAPRTALRTNPEGSLTTAVC